MFSVSISFGVTDFTIGSLVDLCLGEAQSLCFDADWLPEMKSAQNIISLLNQEAI